MALTIDQVLERIGSFGLYQIRLLCVLSFLQWFPDGFQVMVTTFIGAEPGWKCVSNSNATNSTKCNRTGTFRVGDDFYKQRCSMDRSDWTFTDEFTSIVTEFDLVCDKTWLASLSSSLLFGGWLISSIVGGFIADLFGRKVIMIVFMFTCALFGFLSAFPEVYWLFALFRLLAGMSIGAGSMPIFVMITEYVGKRHRHMAGTALWFSWVGSLVSLGGLAYLIRHWRTLAIVTGGLGMTSVFTWWFVPESCRYLLVKEKHKEAETILRNIAKVNKKKYPEEELVVYKEQRTGDIRDLFGSRKMVHRTLVSWFSWTVNAMVYYGVAFSSPGLGGNMYFNYTLTSIVEIPAYILGIWAMGRIGRKKSVVLGLVVAAIASVGAVLCTMYDPGQDKGYFAGRIIMACIAKIAISISFAAIYVYSAELFPTVIRSIGMGSSTAAGRIGSFFAPMIARLNRHHILLPYSIMGGFSLLAAALCMTLPETKDLPLEDVMEDEMENDGGKEEEDIEGKSFLTNGAKNDDDEGGHEEKQQLVPLTEGPQNTEDGGEGGEVGELVEKDKDKTLLISDTAGTDEDNNAINDPVA